jgi:hypothetical protein
LVNGVENLKHFSFSKTVFESVLLSGSQIYLLRKLSAFRLTAGERAPLKLANTRGKRLSPEQDSLPWFVRNAAPAAQAVNFLSLSMEGRAFG